MTDTQPGEPTRPAHDPPDLLHGNLLLTRALDAVRAGNLEAAATILQDASTPLTLGQVFRLHQSELETRAQQLEESQQRIEQTLDWFSHLFRMLPVAAVLVDQHGLVTDANARAIDELALSMALRAVHVPLRRLIADPVAERRLGDLLTRLGEGEQASLDDLELRTLTGQPRWADLRLTCLPPRRGLDQGRQFLCVFNDRTARVEAQLARDAAARAEHERDVAESANQAKTALLSRVSHELRTPLNAVLGFSQLMLMNPDELDDQAQQRLRHIQAAGKHLLSLVEEVLQINRAEAGHLVMESVAVPLEPLARDVLAMHGPAAGELSLTLSLDAPGAVVARADPRRTWEVLANLVTNAIKYNRRNGWVRLTLGQRDGQACVDVADSGLGMGDEQISHLFEPFNRLGADRLKVAGHGLGLSIARSLALAMGGDIEVQSSLGHGSTFTLRLPLATAVS